jgi:hypothetical protein
MAFNFEELVALDRPWIPVTLTIASKERPFKVRRPSAADQDALEAFFSDEYARLVIEKTEPHKDGTLNELERVLHTYQTRSRPELIDQVLGTRYMDIQRRALEIGGESLQNMAKEIAELLPEDRVEPEKELGETLDALRAQAREEVASEYDTKTDEELASLMAQVNINMKSINEARAKQNARQLFYMLHDENEERVFPTIDDVHRLQTATINSFLEKITTALAVADLPFDSRDGLVLDKPSPSPSTSAEATKASGKRTRTRQKSSK